MKLKTIWTLRPMALRERLSRTREWAWGALAHRLPRSLAYWSYIDTGVRHMRSDDVVPEVGYLDILGRIER